ncbi:MAG: hypothetical protein V3T22_00400 [Planctomycetota bacterium]
MADEPKVAQDPSPTSDDTKGAEKSFLEGTYHGQKVSWNEETARSLAQKGLDYETKVAAVKADREAIASDKDEFGKFQQWRTMLQSDPRRAEAVARAFQDPDSFIPSEGGDEDDGNVLQPRAAPVGPSPEVAQLRNSLEQLQGQMKEMTDASAAGSQTQRFERAVGSHSFLSSDNEKALAIEYAQGVLTSNPDMTPEGAMSVAAEKLKGVLQGQNQNKLDGKGKAEAMRTVDPKEGTPQGVVDGKKKPKQDPRKRYQSTFKGNVIREMAEGMFKDRFPNM